MKKTKTIVKALALIITGLAILFFGVFIFGEGFPDIFSTDNIQLKTMLLLMAFAVFGYFFSFWKPKEGGLVLAFSGFLLATNMFYHGGAKDTIAALIYGLPFLIPGILLWWVGGKEK
ncbi:MAG: hypothetical protein K9G76_02705 [Bacteroidales bacterium]|nr:hypothetical protein [Bacteroidales bacterium]MCF8404211.1 hypothetical protein [Bacteroidales bacterium]